VFFLLCIISRYAIIIRSLRIRALRVYCNVRYIYLTYVSYVKRTLSFFVVILLLLNGTITYCTVRFWAITTGLDNGVLHSLYHIAYYFWFICYVCAIVRGYFNNSLDCRTCGAAFMWLNKLITELNWYTYFMFETYVKHKMRVYIMRVL